MIYSSKLLSQTVIELCRKKGIEHIVISPGSRNAPLTIGFTSHSFFKCFSIVDERCAAFFALGMAQQLQKPIVLVCTSGSAVLNYYPAIAEAYYSNIPLIILSADRPKHLIEIGDGQTIKQENVFANHISMSANCKEGEEYQIENEIIINKAFNSAFEKLGPVHINVPFSEPLYDKVSEIQVTPNNIVSNDFEDLIDSKKIAILKEKWKTAKKKLVLVGVLSPNSIEESLLKTLANDDSVIVMTETTSNIYHPNFFPSIDQLITSFSEEDKKEFQPEILLTFGGMIVSKRVKALLRNYPPQEHWHVDKLKAYDTFFALSEHIECSPNYFLKSFLDRDDRNSSNYQSKWLLKKNEKLQKHQTYEKSVPYSDFAVYNLIFKTLQKDAVLQLANSTAIRYAQLFSIDPSIAVFCNRGTSGIDGSTSTAIGAAVANTQPTILVTGDLSFFYDSNALWNNYIPDNFRIILVNNSGGGIFRILPKAKEALHFENFFETKHQLSAKHLCEMFHFEYSSAKDIETIESIMKEFYKKSSTPKLLEIFTPSEINDIVLMDYFETIH